MGISVAIPEVAFKILFYYQNYSPYPWNQTKNMSIMSMALPHTMAIS